MPFRRSLVSLTCLALALALAGCHGPPIGEIPRSTFTADDHGFEGPSALKAGWNRITLRNEGQAVHHMVLYRLTEGQTADALIAALIADGHPEDGQPLGGPNAVAPGREETAWVHLEVGPHVLVCLIPDEEGRPHIAHGMHREVRVDPGGEGVEPPAETGAVDLHDFSFGASDTYAAGNYVFRVDNKGGQVHEAVLFRLAEGVEAADLPAALGTGEGAPPGAPAGGFTFLAPGASAYFRAVLEPGRYAYVCFLKDPDDGVPHHEKGMVKGFEVT